jgi:hypothetical protein
VRKILILVLFTFSFLCGFAVTPAKNDSNSYPIRKISFDSSFRSDSSGIDTSIAKLHILNPAFISDHSLEFLSRLAYPVNSNTIVSRISNIDIFISANYLKTYIQDSKNNFFFDTKRPFTSITYKEEEEGFPSAEREEQLRVFHTQNISSKNNLGLLYNLYSTHTTYNVQRANDHALTIFYRHSGENYLNFNQFYFNSFTMRESGGVTEDSLVKYHSTSQSNGIPSYTYNLYNSTGSAASSYFLRLGLNSIHELKLKKFFENESDTLKSTKDYGSVFYNLNIETTKRSYYDAYDSAFYNKRYYNGSYKTADSVTLNSISNKFVLNSPNVSKYLPNLRFSINNELYFLNFSEPIDTSKHPSIDTLKYNNFYEKTYISTNVSQRFNQIWWNIIWDFNILGYGAGDHAIKGIARMYANQSQTIGLTLNASEEMTTPSFIYNRYISNHYIWQLGKNNNPNLTREKKQELSAVFSTKNPDVSLTADYVYYWNFVYFDSTLIPKQVSTDKPFFIMTYDLKSKFELWKFSFQNDIIFQKNVNGENYIHAPSLIYYNSTEFQNVFHFFTGGILYTKLGVDMYYTSKYLPDGYSSALGTFFVQSDKSTWTGNSPQFDIHLTCKVKTVSFYFKYSNAAANYTPAQRMFSAMHYPILPTVFSYGINWLFYD